MRALLVLALVLAPLAIAPVAAQAPTTFFVNVVSARSLGCSPDSFTAPDLRVVVYVNDAPLFTTEKAQDVRQPLYANLARASAVLPARITVEVQEAEPAGLFGTSWVDCDVAQGAATRHTHTYAGGLADEVRAAGDGEKPAEAILVVGTQPPPAPVVTASTVGSTSATIVWDDTPAATGHALGANTSAPPAFTAAPDVRGATLSELCDNEPYTLRVVREAGAWRVASTVSFRTQNVAPSAPRVLSAARQDGNATIEWEAQDLHDAARFEILVGAGAEPTAVRATVSAQDASFTKFSQVVALQAGDANVRIRLVDEGNLSSASPSFPINATPDSAGAPFARACAFTATALPTPARTTPTPTGTASSTPTPAVSPPTASPTQTSPTPATSATGGASASSGGLLLPNWAILALVALVGVLLGAVIVLLARR